MNDYNPFFSTWGGPQVSGMNANMWGGGGMWNPDYNYYDPSQVSNWGNNYSGGFGGGNPSGNAPPQQQEPQRVDPGSGYTYTGDQGPKMSADETAYWKQENKNNPRNWRTWDPLAGGSGLNLVQEYNPHFDTQRGMKMVQGRDGTASLQWDTGNKTAKSWYDQATPEERAWGDKRIAAYNTQFNPTGGAINQKNVLDSYKNMTDAQRAAVPASNSYYAEAKKLYDADKNVDPSKYSFDRFGKASPFGGTTPTTPTTPAGPTPPALNRMQRFGAQIAQARSKGNLDRVQKLKQHRADYRAQG